MKPVSGTAMPEVQTYYGHEELDIRPCFKLINVGGDMTGDCCGRTGKTPIQFYKKRPESADPVYLIEPTAEEIAKIPLYHALVPREFERAGKDVLDHPKEKGRVLFKWWSSCIPNEYVNLPPSFILSLAANNAAKKRKKEEKASKLTKKGKIGE